VFSHSYRGRHYCMRVYTNKSPVGFDFVSVGNSSLVREYSGTCARNICLGRFWDVSGHARKQRLTEAWVKANAQGSPLDTQRAARYWHFGGHSGVFSGGVGGYLDVFVVSCKGNII